MATPKECMLSGKKSRVTLRDDSQNGFIYYGDWNFSTDGQWFLVEYLSGSYYSGGFVCLANYNVFCDKFPTAFDDGWALKTPGGHQTYGILLHVDRTPDDVWELLVSLADYPCLDDEAVSLLEYEETEATWKNCIKQDWIRACEKQFEFDTDDFPALEAFDWREHFERAREASGQYWEPQGDEQSMWVSVAKCVKNATDPRNELESK